MPHLNTHPLDLIKEKKRPARKVYNSENVKFLRSDMSERAEMKVCKDWRGKEELQQVGERERSLGGEADPKKDSR